MFCLLYDKGVILIPKPKPWWTWGQSYGFGFKFLHEQAGYNRTNGGIHRCALDLCIILTMEDELDIPQAELQ